MDMGTRPEIAWSVDGGETCIHQLDDDHAVMSTPQRVWSLDLRTGRTKWSVDLSGDTETVNCLPGAHLVAVTEVDRFEETVIRITLLDGTTGRRVAAFPGASAVQVIPLGTAIGLVDRSNMMRVVAPGRLDEPLWEQRLPGTEGTLGPIHVQPLDATTVQLWYPMGDDVFMPVLSLADGQPPAWIQASPTKEQHYQRVADVVLSRQTHRGGMTVAVLDLQGRELWNFADAEPGISGSRLYSWSTADSGAQEIRELSPRTGERLTDQTYAGSFDYAFAAPQGRVGVVQAGSVMVLDDHLQQQGEFIDVDYGETYEGLKFLYTGGNMYQDNNSRRTRLTAIDPSTSRIKWDFPLEAGQHVQRLGQHLVVVDNGGRTIHGLESEA